MYRCVPQKTLAQKTVFHIEHNSRESESGQNDRSPYVTDELPTAEPHLVAPTQRLKRAPEAVSQMEPDGHKPNQVEHQIERAAENLLNQVDTAFGVLAQDFRQLHFAPEVDQMRSETA